MGEHEKSYGDYIMRLLFRQRYQDYEQFRKRLTKEDKFWTEGQLFED